jgi:hypothetical protein
MGNRMQEQRPPGEKWESPENLAKLDDAGIANLLEFRARKGHAKKMWQIERALHGITLQGKTKRELLLPRIERAVEILRQAYGGLRETHEYLKLRENLGKKTPKP